MNTRQGSLTGRLREAFALHAAADRTAFLTSGESTSYAAFGQMVDSYAAGFESVGLKRGDFVGIAAVKSVASIAAFFGAMQAGGCPTFMEARIAIDELATRMCSVGMQLLVCENDALIVESRDALAECGARAIALSSLPHTGSYMDEMLRGENRAMLLYTSGSTGRPKGVMLSHANLLCNANGVARHTDVTSADRLLHVMPLHHTNGINNQLIVPLLEGAEIVLIERFRADDIVDYLREFSPTYVTGVPTMYSRMLPKLQSERFPSLRFLRCGSAPITASLHEEIEAAFGVPLLVSYGLSEATCTTTMNPPSMRRIGTIGTVLEGQELAMFVPGTGERVAAGMEGEIRIHGPTLMLGYIGAEVESPVVDGWLRTGDLGRFDEMGYVTITGRIKDVIIRGGENLSPGLIESCLCRHSAVVECSVIGIADADLGEVPVAFVVLREDGIEPKTLEDYVSKNLSRIYVPARISIVNTLPLGSLGKVDKRALRLMLHSDAHA